MPIDRTQYPDNWREFSLYIRRVRAADRCECVGECGRDHEGRCPAINGQRKFVFGILGVSFRTVWLTTAHLWKHGCECEQRCAIADHVKALCQACHLRYDEPQHKSTREKNKDGRRPLIRIGGTDGTTNR